MELFITHTGEINFGLQVNHIKGNTFLFYETFTLYYNLFFKSNINTVGCPLTHKYIFSSIDMFTSFC